MTIRFEKSIADVSLVSTWNAGNKEKHKIFKDEHYVGFIIVARAKPNHVCLSFYAEANKPLDKWWGEMSLEECKVFVIQNEGKIHLHPDLQEHYDNVIATSAIV